jgi:hypothetical protein
MKIDMSAEIRRRAGLQRPEPEVPPEEKVAAGCSSPPMPKKLDMNAMIRRQSGYSGR